MTPMTPPLAAARAGDVDVDDVTARLRLSATRLARILRQQADTGLTLTRMSALAAIHRAGPLTLGALADVEHVAPPSITKVVDHLERDGLVERRSDPADGRVRLVATTPAGVDLLDASRARKDAWLATRLATLEPSELARLAGALDALEHIIRKDEQ
ncbi:MAG: transcriptional regulator, MarR family [Acidimicrobiales bacterium]|nr:transcriptional regulator, MarR family [Acidimicrobiales bacterium]